MKTKILSTLSIILLSGNLLATNVKNATVDDYTDLYNKIENHKDVKELTGAALDEIRELIKSIGLTLSDNVEIRRFPKNLFYNYMPYLHYGRLHI